MTAIVRKILIRGVNWIGDAVLTTPAIKAVRRVFPDAHISLLVKPLVAEIFKGNPHINEIILYDDRFNSIMGRFKLARMLKARGFSTAILLQNAFDAAFITWLAGIPERIGYRRDWRRLLLTRSVPVEQEVLDQHQVHYYLNLLDKSLNISAEDTEPRIYLSQAETNDAKALLSKELGLTSGRPVIGINPGAAYGSAKRWMPERFAELAKKIVDELDGRVVLFGNPAEAEIAGNIISRLTFSGSYCLNMAGKTDLRQLAALISECDAFITNDSGPMHMASALLVPTVAIFGSTDRTKTGPFGEGCRTVSKDLACSPCLERECPEGHLKCMTAITAEDIFEALKDVLPKEKAVFLDRDGTVIEDAGYLNSFSNLRIFDHAVADLEKLKHAGFKLIGITNQSGIARGLVSEDFVRASNAYLKKTLGIDDFYFCPHHPDDDCRCRKPKTLLLRRARLKHNIDLKHSYVVGDKIADMLLAKEAGAKGVLVQTGQDMNSEAADFVAKNLNKAVDWILQENREP